MQNRKMRRKWPGYFCFGKKPVIFNDMIGQNMFNARYIVTLYNMIISIVAADYCLLTSV